MSDDVVKQYLQLRTKLAEEKSRVEARLQEINQALGQSGAAEQSKRPAGAGSAIPSRTELRTRSRKRIKNSMPLRAAIVKVTSEKPLTKPEILTAVQKLGYKFGTNKPMLSINPILYGDNPKFKRNGGKFRAGK